MFIVLPYGQTIKETDNGKILDPNSWPIPISNFRASFSLLTR